MDFNDISTSLNTKHSPVQEIEALGGIVKLKKRGVGRPKKPQMKAKLFRLNMAIISKIDTIAEEEGITPSQLIIKAINKYNIK